MTTNRLVTFLPGHGNPWLGEMSKGHQARSGLSSRDGDLETTLSYGSSTCKRVDLIVTNDNRVFPPQVPTLPLAPPTSGPGSLDWLLRPHIVPDRPLGAIHAEPRDDGLDLPG